MLAQHVSLIDHDAALVRAWGEAFEDVEGVSVHEADFFSIPADAMVSPANSFGIMDGGLDAAIRNELGFAVEKAAQRAIVERHHGELPVGSAEIVETGHPAWPYLIVAPTMRVPESVSQTLNPYLAFRAALLAIRARNALSEAPVIRSVVCPGLGTGIGAVEPRRCAVQMRMAFKQVFGPARLPSFAAIHGLHRALRTA
jgi:O-acetyl-ADP-ribose deacetylase (regulator of RNase III)